LLNQKDDGYLMNKSQILAEITSFLGGRVSEELFIGGEHVTIGAYADFKKALALTRDLVLRYGMSDLGIISAHDSPVFGEETLNELSESKRQKIEKEIEKILSHCQQKARQILQDKKNILHLFAQALVEKGTLQREEINYIFVNQKLPYIALL
jgi:cell division protease FtsH